MLEFDGEIMPEPKSLEVSREKIWSSNTGRVDSGKMTGDVVAIKTTLKITWAVLSSAQTQKIDKHLSKAFFSCTYLDPSAGNTEKTKTFYSGAPTYPVYSYVNGYPDYVGVGVDLIEQ